MYIVRPWMPLLGCALGIGVVVSGQAQTIPAQVAVVRAKQLVTQMSLGEKVVELHGSSDHFRYVPGIPHLGIPPLTVTNGPAGAGPGHANPQPRATQLPAPIALASTWDRRAAFEYGVVEGTEARDTGSNLLEGPDINIIRVPQGGRSFESYSEDPFLDARIAVADIDGIQSTGVMADVKHFDANNQETDRTTINEIVGKRALHEIYLPAFRAAVKQASVAAVMCAYPSVDGSFNCQNKFLLTKILRKRWGFTGFVTSDFGATHSTIPSALAGLDLEMPTGKYFSDPLRKAVQSHELPVSVVDRMLVRRFAKMIEFGWFQRLASVSPIPVSADAHVARAVEDKGAVLLKNEKGILPLDAGTVKSIALIGKIHDGGGGSSHVIPFFTVLPRHAIRGSLPLPHSLGPQLRVQDGSNIEAAVKAARQSSIAIVIVSDHDSEGRDQSLTLPGNQNRLVAAVAEANPRTIVILQTGSAVVMPWVKRVAAVVEMWYPGEEDGNALADIVFGKVNPSGKLPITFPRKASQTFARNRMEYPGNGNEVEYREGINVGYRWYQTSRQTPLFPFGFGLSYTTFKFSDLHVTATRGSNHEFVVTFQVTNTGARAGAEVGQVYVGFPNIKEGNEPPNQLKGFERVYLTPGQTRTVAVVLGDTSFSYWNVKARKWAVQPGEYRVRVGDSSADLPLTAAVTIQ